jgi:hypothetical protein
VIHCEVLHLKVACPLLQRNQVELNQAQQSLGGSIFDVNSKHALFSVLSQRGGPYYIFVCRAWFHPARQRFVSHLSVGHNLFHQSTAENRPRNGSALNVLFALIYL